MNRRHVFGGIAAAVLVALAWLASPDAALTALGWLAADPLRYGLALLALTAVRPLLAWPTTLIAVAAGFGYGWAGLPLAVAAMTLTALAPYRLARAGRLRLTDDSSPVARIGRAGDRLVGDAGGVRAIAATRFLPVPADAVSVAAGVSAVRLRPFVVGTAIGESPWAVAGVAVGVSADRLAGRGLSGFDPVLFLGAGLAGLLLLAGPLYRVLTHRGVAAT